MTDMPRPTILTEEDLAKLCANHERNAQEVLLGIQVLLVDGMKLSPEIAPDIFDRFAKLRVTIQMMFNDAAYLAHERTIARVRGELAEFARKL